MIDCPNDTSNDETRRASPIPLHKQVFNDYRSSTTNIINIQWDNVEIFLAITMERVLVKEIYRKP